MFKKYIFLLLKLTCARKWIELTTINEGIIWILHTGKKLTFTVWETIVMGVSDIGSSVFRRDPQLRPKCERSKSLRQLYVWSLLFLQFVFSSLSVCLNYSRNCCRSLVNWYRYKVVSWAFGRINWDVTKAFLFLSCYNFFFFENKFM